MAQSGQLPERPYDGSLIPQTSIPGKNVNFVLASTIVSGSGSMGAAGTSTEVLTFEISLAVTISGRVVQWDNLIAWDYVEFYVDTENVGKVYRTGPTLTDAQKRIEMSYKPLYFAAGPTPSIYSHISYWSFRNFDTSGHSIIGYSQWKYIQTA